MSPAVEDLYQSALALSGAERVALAEALLAAPDHPPAPELRGEAYRAELRRRSANADPSGWSSWEEVRRRVHARLGLPESGGG